jgi:hypothetical protein
VSEVSVAPERAADGLLQRSDDGEFAMTLMMRTNRPDATVAPAIAADPRIDPEPAVTNVRMFERRCRHARARAAQRAGVRRVRAQRPAAGALGVYGCSPTSWPSARERLPSGWRSARTSALTRPWSGAACVWWPIGAVRGLAVSLALLRSLSTLLFDVTPYDVPTYATVVALLCAGGSYRVLRAGAHAAAVQPLLRLARRISPCELLSSLPFLWRYAEFRGEFSRLTVFAPRLDAMGKQQQGEAACR